MSKFATGGMFVFGRLFLSFSMDSCMCVLSNPKICKHSLLSTHGFLFFSGKKKEREEEVVSQLLVKLINF